MGLSGYVDVRNHFFFPKTKAKVLPLLMLLIPSMGAVGAEICFQLQCTKHLGTSSPRYVQDATTLDTMRCPLPGHGDGGVWQGLQLSSWG